MGGVNMSEKKQWINAKEPRSYEIDLSPEMFRGMLFDNGFIFIDFGPIPPKPLKHIIRLDKKIFPCETTCFNCDFRKECWSEEL